MNIIYLERQLRSGKTPEQLGATIIGRGVQKKAYRIDNLVIKENTGGFRDGKFRAPKGIENYGAKMVRQYRVKQWVIQEFVTPLKDQFGNWLVSNPEIRSKFRRLYDAHLGDIHAANCGVNSRGELVVFDW